MTERPTRPRTFAVLAAVLALVTAPGAAGARTADPLVGRWDTTVSSPGKPPTRVVIEFRADYRVDITGQVSIGGQPAYTGAGTWRRTSTGTVAFDVTHPLPAPDGSLLGTARSHQEGTTSPDRFSTTGEAYVDQPDGTTTGPYPAAMTGTPTRR
ncbi:hypothetical protein ACFYOT_10145 [Saccharothrix saharensis]|uniref:hypothetical protein n=1 Tax=Saccharothrix saharensis TaxID=571190 RepID=UPI0036B780CC